MGTLWADHKSKKSQQQWTISWSDCNVQQKVDFTRQPETTSLVTGPQRSPKHFPRPDTPKKKGHGHCMLVCGPSDPLQLSESWQNHSIYKYALQIEEMHQKLPHLQPTLVNRKAPIFLHDNAPPHITRPTLQNLNELGYEVLSHLWYSADLSPTTTFLSILTTFFSENAFTTSRRQKMLSKSSCNPKEWIFMLQE